MQAGDKVGIVGQPLCIIFASTRLGGPCPVSLTVLQMECVGNLHWAFSLAGSSGTDLSQSVMRCIVHVVDHLIELTDLQLINFDQLCSAQLQLNECFCHMQFWVITCVIMIEQMDVYDSLRRL